MQRNNARNSASGFTLIELALCITVTVIVGAAGVSAYRTYSVRAEVAESIALTEPLQRMVELLFHRSGLAAADAATEQAANSIRGSYITAIDVVDGRLQLLFGHEADAAIAGRTLSITPFETAEQRVIWICGNRGPGPGLRPLGFAGGGAQAVQVPTIIEARYLPPTCR